LKPPATSTNCRPTRFLDTAVSECVFGRSSSQVTVALFGDSHARQWTPAFEALVQEKGWRLVEIAKDACPSADVEIFNSTLKRSYFECDTWRKAAIDRLVAMRPAVIVVSNRQLQNFSSGLRPKEQVWGEATRRTLQRFDSAGIQTVLLRDTPDPQTDILDCLTGDLSWWSRWRASKRDPCNSSREQALDGALFRAEQDALAGLRHASVLDLSDFFCDGPVCPPIRNEMIVYRDDSHITWKFARSLAPALADRLVPLLQAAEPQRSSR